MKPVVSPAQDSLELSDEVLALHAWRMPDMVLYQHAYEEWWLAPLEDTVPLVKINRAGLNLLNAMNGKVTVAALLEKFGPRVCGPNGETGLLANQLKKHGWWDRNPRVILEVGGGLGYVARDLGGGLSPEERQDTRYVFVDITRPFVKSQLAVGREGGWAAAGLQANAEQLPLRDASLDLAVDNENLADMTPVKLTRREGETGKGASPLHQDALAWIRRAKLSLGAEVPEDFIFNLGPVRFVAELWRVLKPGGRAILVEFGIEEGVSAPVKLPGHTEYEVQYSHLRQVARFLGFQEKFGALPHFLILCLNMRVLCTGAAYAIRRFCEAAGRSFAIRAYTESEFRHALGDMLPKLSGHHFHDISDPAWFGLWDFKVLLLEKPTAAPGPRPAVKDVKGFRWGGMR